MYWEKREKTDNEIIVKQVKNKLSKEDKDSGEGWVKGEYEIILSSYHQHF